jgi:hypothetical protein
VTRRQASRSMSALSFPYFVGEPSALGAEAEL